LVSERAVGVQDGLPPGPKQERVHVLAQGGVERHLRARVVTAGEATHHLSHRRLTVGVGKRGRGRCHVDGTARPAGDGDGANDNRHEDDDGDAELDGAGRGGRGPQRGRFDVDGAADTGGGLMRPLLEGEEIVTVGTDHLEIIGSHH
jgi:hypothetical protein